ncbi:MAG: hypothetical protein F4080_05765 [Holophagales bacterium]|nr:hypothetical protein [Holophagales bacterium]
MIERASVPHRSHSPLVIVNALALTIATLVTGAWDAGCHDDDASTPSNVCDAWCPTDREAEATAATNHASLDNASAPNEHSCVACRIGSSKSAEIGRDSVSRPLDLASAAARPDNDGSASRGAPRQQAARGPPSA